MRLRLSISLVLVSLSVASIGSAQPVVAAITNAADYSGSIAPGSIATIFGSGFTTGAPMGAVSTPLSNTLNGVTLYVNSLPAPIFYVSAVQINFQVPTESTADTGTLTLQATTGSTTVALTLQPAAPGIFQYGVNRAVAVDYPTPLNSETAPAASGQTLVVYLTGIGNADPTLTDGYPTPSSSLFPSPYTSTASIGGVDAPVAFLGLAPGFVGLAQANITVPSLPNGDYPLSFTLTVPNSNAPSGAGTTFTSQSAIVTISGTGTPPPSILTYVSSASVPTTTLQTNVKGAANVQVNGSYAYVCSVSEISVIDVSNPQAPGAAVSFGASDLNGVGTLCQIDQNYLVELTSGTNILVYDLTTSATNPTLIGGPVALQTPYSGNFTFDGSTAIFDTSSASWSLSSDYFLSETGVIETYNFANWASPAFDADFTPPTGYTDNTSPRFGIANLGGDDIAVLGTTNNGVGNFVPSVAGEGQVTVINVTTPASPVAVTELMVPQTVSLQGIALQGTTALIAGNTQAWNNPVLYVGSTPEFLNDGNLTLSVLDFTNPQSPQILSTTVTDIQSSGGAGVVSLGGGFYALSIAPPVTGFQGPGTLAILDATTPMSPVLYPYAVIDGLGSLALSGNYLYVTTAQGISIYQVTLPG
jgi:uncharacterized protein (TIGR03437 family)